MPTALRPYATGFARLGRAVLASLDEPSDTWLLDQFVANHDAEAFAALVGRHGPMVLAVCRRVTGDTHLADDAFQAVFLVLARRAGVVRPRSALRGWLYVVAVRTAQTARTRAHKRARRERPVPTLPDRPAPEPRVSDPSDLRALDEEIARLPERLRSAVILCELDGLTRKGAATRLGVPEGTLSSRLAKARKVLAARLRARGVVPAAGLGALLGRASSATAVPPTLATAAAALASPGAVPGAVLQLMHGAQKVMLMEKLKFLATGALLGLGLVVAGVVAAPAPVTPDPPPVRVVAISAPVAIAPPPRVVVVDPKLDAHLAAWERQRKGTINVFATFTLTRKDAIQKNEEKYRGSILHMKPGFARMRLDSVEDPGDYVAYISNGNSIWGYRGREKTITDFRLTAPEPASRPERWLLELEKALAQRMYSQISPNGDGAPSMLGDVTEKGLRERYAIHRFREDERFIYLDLKPRRAAEAALVEKMSVTLHHPATQNGAHAAYAPAQVEVRRTNGDTEVWAFSESMWNIHGVEEKAFAFVPMRGWKVLKGLPDKPAPLPPAGGAAKP